MMMVRAKHVFALVVSGLLCWAHGVRAQDGGRTIEDLIEGQGVYASPPGAEKPAAAAPAASPAPPAADAAAPATAGATPTNEPAAIEPVTIVWRLENPFRFFTDPTDTDEHRSTFLALAPDERAKGPVLAAERVLSRRYDAGWAESVVRKTCWDTDKNRYICKERPDYINPQSHTVLVSVKGVFDTSVDCTWVTTPRSGKSVRGKRTTRPCREGERLEIPYPAGASVKVEIGGQQIAETEIKVKDLLVAGIGDSFGSGEGNPDVPVHFSHERAINYGKPGDGGKLGGYPARVGPWKQVGDADFVSENARWLDQACHRSLYSYEMRAALQLAVEDPHRSITYVGLACSGAEVTFGLFLRYKGNEWVPKPPDLSQISAVADAQCGKIDAPLVDMPEAYHINGTIPELQGGLSLKKCPINTARKIDLLLVSVGGNDIGFARLVANAVLSDGSLVRSLGGWFGQVHGNKESEELLDRLDNRYKALNRAVHGILHMPWDQSDRIILTSYPPLALLDDSGHVCPDGNAGMEVFSDFNITEKSALSSSWLADKLDQIMETSAARHGWSYVAAHRNVFVGRGICAGHTSGSGTVADDLRMPRRIDDRWVPYNPALFQAYAQRQRWFRTPNDAFLTGNFHASGSVLQKVLRMQSLSWFQVLLASTYSGAFHPTAEGHAAIADAVVERARTVLRKYGQETDAAGLAQAGAKEPAATP